MLKFTEIKPVGELGKLIFDSLNDETLDIFWDKRRDQMLECAFKYDFIDGLPGLKDDAKRAIANSRKCGRMSANLIISLRQKIKDLNPVYRNQWTRQMGLPIIAEFVNKYDTLPGWQILLAASTLSSIPGFPKEAAVFPEELKAALADADREKETLEKFAPFAPFARAIAGFVYIPLQRESALKEYGQKISSADYNSWDTPEQIRAYEKNVIKPWLELRRNAKFAARKLRNILSAMPEGVVVLEGKEPEDLPILVGDRKFCAGVVGRLIKAMEATLPPVFSLDDTLAGLAAIEPPLSEKDMTRARAEAEKIAAGELAPGASWLMAWILPVIRGEAAGDMERMEALEDSLGDWPYSLKLSNGLLQNRYKLAPEQAGNAVASSPEASAKDAAGGKPPASSETRVVAEDKSSVSPEADVVAENRPAPANGTGREAAGIEPRPEEPATGKAVETAPEKLPKNGEISDKISEPPAGDEEAAGADSPLAEESANEPAKATTKTGSPEAATGGHGLAPASQREPVGFGLKLGELMQKAGAKMDESPEIPETAGAGSETVLEPFPYARVIARAPASPERKPQPRPRRDYPRITEDEFASMGNMGSLGSIFGQKTTREERREEAGEEEKTEDEPRDNKKNKKTSAQKFMEEAVRYCVANPLRYDPAPPAREDIKGAYDKLIRRQDAEALYWLSRTLDGSAPVPLWLVEYLLFGLGLVYAGKEAREKNDALLRVVLDRHQELDENSGLLLLTALLRPALIMPSRDMTTIFSALSRTLASFGISPLLEKLEDFARIGTPLDESVLTGQTWEQLRRTRYERLKNETENFLRQSVSGKTKYQPATFARRNLFGEAGELGKILMECVRNKPRDLEEKIRFLNDPKNRDSMIERNQPRAYTKEIKAKARQKLLSDMDECERLMREWLDYYADVRKVVSGSYQEKSFKEICDGDLSGKIAAVPEGAWLATELARLRSREAPKDLRYSDDSLSLWPMTMVSAIPAGENIFSPAALVAELLEDKYGADETRAANAAIQLARGYIAQFNKLAESWPELLSMEPPREIIAASLPDLGQAGAFSFDELAEISKERWNEFFEAEFNAIQEYISDCYFRGAIIDKKQNDANAKLNGLRARANGDTDSVYLTEKLRLLRRELEDADDSMLEEVERRLEKLRSEAGREDIGEYVDRTLAEVRHSRAYSAALDALARMEDYLTSGKGPAPSPVVAERKKESAARDFYEKLENGQISETAYGPNEWRDAVSLRNSRLDSGFNRIITKLIRWFGFQLERAEQSAVIFRGGAPFYWHIMEYKMTINSPMPLWGSQSRGRHVLVFGWGRVSPADIDRIMTSGNIRENMAATLFCFCPLSVRDREQILKASVKWPVFPLIVDSNLFNYLVARDEGDRTRAFFEIALAGARYNPYTPDAFGAVAKEMFVGRAAERETVMNPTGACIIYGGRQLGKSALLQQVYNDYKDNVTTVVVSVILGKSESSLLDKLIKECVSRKIVPPQTTRNTFQQNVQKWLDEDDARRLVALLDECDNALEKDEARSFEEIEVFRNLMQTSERRFKAVFTGLHSVQRFGHFPNSPIYHLGDPVCVGPLERDAARELMEDRMSILGFGFESPQLPLMALNYCSYQPKLIQMFCSELITALQKNPDRPLLANITRAEMLAVYESHNLKKKIQECFTMTLDLDPRYFVIAYAMALYGVEGAAIDDLWEELKDYWPAAFKNCNLQTIRGLLHEMEGLGLVISLGGAYRLRAPHIIELLGGEENILLELSQKAGQDYTPPNDPDQLRIKGADIFVATQYNMLADKTSALYWVTGSKALGLDKTPEALEKIAGQNESGLSIACGRIEGASAEEAIKNLGRMYDKIRSGGLLAWISSEQLKDPGRFLPEAEKWLQKLRSDKKFVKIVFLVQPRDQYDFIRENIADKYSSYEIRLTPWSRTGIEDRCREESLPIKRAAELDDQTGGWHCVMPGNFSQDAADATAVAELTREILNEIPGLDEISGQFGILDIVEVDKENIEVARPDDMSPEDFKNCIKLMRNLSLLREKDNKIYLDKFCFANSSVS